MRGKGSGHVRRDKDRRASRGSLHRQALGFVSQRVTTRNRQGRNGDEKGDHRRGQVRAIRQATRRAFARSRLLFFARRVMIYSGRRSIANDSSRRQSRASGNKGTSFAHNRRRNGSSSGRYRERVRRSGTAFYHVIRLRMRRRRGRYGTRRKDRRRNAANDLFAFGLSTMFCVVPFQRTSFFFCPILSIIRRATRIAPTNVNQSCGFSFCILAISNVKAREEDRVYRVKGEGLPTLYVIGRRFLSAFRHAAIEFYNACRRIGNLSLFVCLQRSLANRVGHSGLARLQRQSAMLDRRFVLQRGLRFQALGLLLRVRINGSFCVARHLLCLIASNGRPIRIIARRLSNGTYLYATRRNVGAVTSKLPSFGINAHGSQRFIARFVRWFNVQTIFRFGEYFCFKCVRSRHVFVRFHASDLANCNLGFEGQGRRFLYLATCLIKFFR